MNTRSPREEVWLALSDLFLDAEVSLHRDHILRTLRASPFDLDTLDEIFIREVYPACISNLYDVAGEWAGFEEERLFARIAQQQDKRLLFPRLTLWLRWRHARRMVPEWAQIRAELRASET
jgi:hypothetical protein